MMFAPRIIYGLLALLAVGASAQPVKEIVEPAKAEAREPARDAEVQHRRAVLRASLKLQAEVAVAREVPTSSARLLSAQERAALRQQLRQQ
jgi:hypothetical protein